MLKLVSEKNLWHDCRKNGWKNIHLYSWPEHCRSYLTRVAACRMRHPHWQTDTPLDDEMAAGEMSFNDSLKDVQDMSLRLSVDGERGLLDGSLNLGSDVPDHLKHVMSRMKKPEPNSKDGENAKADAASSKYPILRRRRRLMVIAVDCYDSKGMPEKKMIQIVQNVLKATRLDSQYAKLSGVVISTAMPLSETIEFLKSAKIQVNEFDALICSSGSEVYYPGTYADANGKLIPDPDYASHIDYRWGREGLRKTIRKIMDTPEGEEKSTPAPSPIEEDVKSSNSHCVAYLIKDPSKVDTLT